MSVLLRIGFVLLAASFFIACDVLSAHWGKTGGAFLLLLLWPVAPVGYLVFGILNRNTSLSISAGLVNTTIAIGTILIGLFAYHEVLSIRQYFGLLFAVISVLLLLV